MWPNDSAPVSTLSPSVRFSESKPGVERIQPISTNITT